ncbi:DUF6783 domain-containing protein [uncultured Robinsoniella sp.]
MFKIHFCHLHAPLCGIFASNVTCLSLVQFSLPGMLCYIFCRNDPD